MDNFDWISFVAGVISGIFACFLVSDLVFPNSKHNWEDEDDPNPS